MANLFGSPITYTVKAFKEDSTLNYAFHRLYIVITIGDMVITNSTAVESEEEVEFDISSALRAAFDGHTYTPISATMSRPSLSYSVTKYEKYMVDGNINTTSTGSVGSGVAYPGKYSDLQRYKNVDTVPAKLSLKPSTGELAKKGSALSIGGTVYATTTEGSSSTSKYHVIDDDNMYEIQFVNSFGMVESACAWCLIGESFSVEENEYTRSYGVGFRDVNRFVNRKSAQRYEYKMSSGPVNREWQKWWLNEVCMADQSWIKIDGTWIPCSISTDDGGEGIDKSKVNILSCEFVVKLNIEGK